MVYCRQRYHKVLDSGPYQSRFDETTSQTLPYVLLAIFGAHVLHLYAHPISGLVVFDVAIAVCAPSFALLHWLKPIPVRFAETAMLCSLGTVCVNAFSHQLVGIATSDFTLLITMVVVGITLVSPRGYVTYIALTWALTGTAKFLTGGPTQAFVFVFVLTTMASVIAYVSQRRRHIEMERLRDKLSHSLEQTNAELHARKRLQEALQQSEEKYRLIAENVEDVVYVYNGEGVITYVSPSIEKLLGYTPDERIGMHFEETSMSEASKQKALAKFIEALEGKTDSAMIEMQHKTKAGDLVWTETRVNVARGAESEITGIYVLVRDITERRRTDALLERQRQRLAERSAELTDVNIRLDGFAATVSHDLRAPLRRVIRSLETLAEDPSAAEALRPAIQELRNMSKLIEHLLDTSVSKKALARSEVDLGKTLRSIVARLRVETGRDCELAAPADGEATVWADPQLVMVLLTNLVSNAYKYTPANQQLVLRLEISADADEPEIRFLDNGDGFPVEHISMLFDTFVQGSNENEGFGIGLSTVETIIKRHGGTVSLQNRPEGGACISFTLGKGHGNTPRVTDRGRSN